jgi:DNA repair protein RecO (recombination protein O)
MITYRDDAFLLSIQRAGPEGKILTFFTRQRGLAKLYYRRFPRRARTEFFDVLQRGELVYAPQGEQVPGRLHSFDCGNVWPGIRGSFDGLVCALHLAETARMLANEEEAAPELFDLLAAALDSLEGKGHEKTMRIVFFLRALRVAGFALTLDRCLACGAEAIAPVCFSPGVGVVCAKCAREKEKSWPRMSQGALSVMTRALALPLEKIGRLRVSDRLAEEILPLLLDALERALDTRPSSVVFLSKMEAVSRREGKTPF